MATAPETVSAILDTASTASPLNSPTHPYLPTGAIARVVGVSQDTVANMLAKHQPVADTLRSLQRDHLLGAWQWNFLSAYDQVTELASIATPTLKERRDKAAIQRDLSVTMGISTERALLLTGQATQLVGHLHEVRVSLPEIASRLAEVGKALKRPQPVEIEASDVDAAGQATPLTTRND